MSIVMGPVLNFRGIEGGEWRVSALCVVPDQVAGTPMNWSIGTSGPTSVTGLVLKSYKGKSVVRYDIAVAQTQQAQTVAYQLTDREDGPFSFVVPPKGAVPNCAYASCNGFSNPKDMNKVQEKNVLWRSMKAAHEKKRFHLLLMGGDQVYADSIWKDVERLEAWSNLDREARRKAQFTNPMRRAVEDFYFNLYCERWNQKEVIDMFSSIPTIMMWDDHDIFDGWGSYPAKDQFCRVNQGIFEIARDHFAIFQQQIDPTAQAPQNRHPAALAGQDHFTLTFEFGKLAIVAPDLRSERTLKQVMTPKTWDAITPWLDQLSKTVVDHLFVMSSIPVVHPDLSWAEEFFDWLPGQQELEDDLHDHWNSPAHKEERVRLIHRLLDTAQDKEIRTTLISGDVHVAAIGAVQSMRDPKADRNATVINQLTSSAIVHPAPPGIMNMVLELIGRSEQEIDRDINIRMLKFAGTSERFLTRRNWLSLEPDDQSQPRIWAIFHVENDEAGTDIDEMTTRYTKVVHPVEKSAAANSALSAQAA
jgi:PhoD related phosphatase